MHVQYTCTYSVYMYMYMYMYMYPHVLTLLQCLGMVGLVQNVSLNEMEIAVSFSICCNKFHVPSSALKKVYSVTMYTCITLYALVD